LNITGNLYEEADILNWLLVQKNPHGEIIEEINGQDLKDAIASSESIAVFFCECLILVKKMPVLTRNCIIL